VCNSERAKSLWLRYHPRYAYKLKVIYNSIIVGTPASSYVFRRNGKLNIIVPASVKELKNPSNLITGLSLLSPDQRKDVVVHWYGTASSGEYLEYIKRQAREHNLEDVLVFFPATNEIHNFMNSADVVA